MEHKEISKLIASTYWDLKRDCEQIDTKEIYYDTGYMVALCLAIGKKKLGQKIYDSFMLK
jgi:predicted metalloprotease with PDZ domain|tara:strand:- start:1950 stop:2129 length:180 start_codon:yes stop_codon:yes gene_type:complete